MKPRMEIIQGRKLSSLESFPMKTTQTHIMKTPRWNPHLALTRFLLVALVWMTVATAIFAGPLGTAFTYSGRLKYQNQPANGAFDLQVKLFNDPVLNNPNNQVGQTLTISALSVANGLFVTSLDFGGGIFNGTAYWLEIWARPSGNNPPPYTLLSPRQPLNPAPYSLFAPLADTANNAAVNSVANSSIQNNAVSASKIASGQVVKSLNGLFDNVSLQAGANVTLTPNGNALTIGSIGGSGSWSLTGNSGTTPGQNFLGTTDNEPLEFWVNNARALRFENSSTFNGITKQFVDSINVIGGFLNNRVVNGAGGATISGGGFYDSQFNINYYNEVGAAYGSIGGGANNRVEALYGTVPGGLNNQANGYASFAAGLNAHAVHDKSFLWSDGAVVNSSGPNLFEVYSRSGATFHTGNGYLTADGPFLVVNGLGSEQAYFGGDGVGSDVQIGSLNSGIANVSLWNATSGSYMNLYVATLTITGGSDLAEPFAISTEGIPEGSVVVIDEQHPGQLKLSSEPYDTRVAGVVSGANGINPGISLKQKGRLDDGRNVALSGRVYVLADADKGPIQPGDLLTSSSTPGHAMRATDHVRAQGAVLGKAMGALPRGKGLLLVLVSLQ
jgi:hypothetical protein